MRLWRDWCRLWPEQYGHNSLQVQSGGYDPVFDVIPCQTYKDFYLEVARHHPRLRSLNPFEVIDTALNQIRAPETTVIMDDDETLDEPPESLVVTQMPAESPVAPDDAELAADAAARADVYAVELDNLRQQPLHPGQAAAHQHPSQHQRQLRDQAKRQEKRDRQPGRTATITEIATARKATRKTETS